MGIVVTGRGGGGDVAADGGVMEQVGLMEMDHL